MNSVNIIGNIGHDLELRYTGTGKAVLNLSIAVSNYNNETEWFRVVIWNAQAENTAKYCKKGSKIGVTGRLSTNEYEDKSGQKRENVEIVAQSVEFLSYLNDQDNQQNQSSYQTNNQTQNNSRSAPVNQNTQADDPFESNEHVTDIPDDDLPF